MSLLTQHRLSPGVAAALALALLTQGTSSVRAQATRCEIDRVDRIVAVGDVHGAYDRFVEILTVTGLIDAQQRWSGGETHLVQLGDVVDRGPDSRKVLDLLIRLQEEARRADGAVHVLLGNHEVMRMLGDLRYVTAGEYQAFVTPRSEEIRQDFVSKAAETEREARLKETPLGFIEMVAAFTPAGQYGEWLRKLNTVVRINGILFVHGGLSPASAAMSCSSINDTVRRELTRDLEKSRQAPLATLSAGENGPLWYRGLGQSTDSARDVDGILEAQKARAIVIGHSVSPDRRIQTRFGNRVIQVDTGMQSAYVPDGRASALEIRAGAFTAVYSDRRDLLFQQ
jgi:hypothetical protein